MDIRHPGSNSRVTSLGSKNLRCRLPTNGQVHVFFKESALCMASRIEQLPGSDLITLCYTAFRDPPNGLAQQLKLAAFPALSVR